MGAALRFGGKCSVAAELEEESEVADSGTSGQDEMWTGDVQLKSKKTPPPPIIFNYSHNDTLTDELTH